MSKLEIDDVITQGGRNLTTEILVGIEHPFAALSVGKYKTPRFSLDMC